ncbi:ROK family protein [Streptomyces sp. TS71-3]|uniref:ROK family protein n=1 Tax=Streptomyces sp. TS71-3 TaxID=2733862 RepID=UPI0020173C3B|nr:ROK family protein [Streptomyces sp. TS71-3]
MREMADAAEPPLTEKERAALRAWARGSAERAVRARIVLDADAGLSVTDSARHLGVSRPTVTTWRRRYAAEGIAGLEHRPRSGRPPQVDEADVVAATLAGPPSPAAVWSARALADRLGISHTTLAGVWRRWGAGPGDGRPPTVPAGPPCPTLRSELLGVWAQGDGAALLVVGQVARPAGQPGRAADTEERRAAHAALGAQLDRVRAVLGGADGGAGSAGPSGSGNAGSGEPGNAGPGGLGSAGSGGLGSAGSGDPGSTAPGGPGNGSGGGPAALIAAVAERHPDRILHALVWGDAVREEAGAAGTPAVTWHRADRTMSWPGTVCTLALSELVQVPGRFRPALRTLVDAARAFADAARGGEVFTWRRAETAGSRVPAPRPAPRAFNQLALGSYNEKLVIESIRESGALSRVEIAEQTGLTPQAVSRITRNLLTAGLLAEDARQSSGAGKPRVPLRLRPDAACAVGVHLDPEMISVVTVDLCGDVLDHRRLQLTGRRDPEWCLTQMARLALESAEATRPASENLLGVGVAVPGPLDARAGVVLDPPLFDGWEQVALKTELADRLGAPVIVEKDATAAAIGERWLGAADRASDFVYLYLGAGAGSGAFLNGDVYRGSTGNAGEVGELCAIKAGLLTDEGGPRMVDECAPISAAVQRAAAAGLPVPEGDGAYDWVCAAAAQGDGRAVRVLAEVAQVVALGAVGIIDLFDVELLIVGGPAMLPSVAGIYLREIAAAVNRFPVARRVRDVQVAHSRLNQAAAPVGAASSVFHSAFTPTLGARTRPAHRGTARM